MIVVNDHFSEQSGIADSRKIFSFLRLKEVWISYWKETKLVRVTGSSSFVHFPGPVSFAPTTTYLKKCDITTNETI